MSVGLCLMTAIHAAVCAALPPEPGPGITQVSITEPASSVSVPVGGTLGFSCSTVTDWDILKCDDGTDHPVLDTITYIWTGGSFTPSTGQHVTWTAPAAPGNVQIYVRADDSPIAEDSYTAATITIPVVNVADVLYEDPVLGYVPVVGTLYVMKGTTVKFKAIKNPAEAAWPNGKPVWGGTAWAHGTDETTSVTFTSVGDKTVTVECGNIFPVNVKVYELIGVHGASSPLKKSVFRG